ncbi:hypothetical protein GDO78_019922 [Eleutherodactylus coqui]|uniref:Uncharacterized protein n=1 Tax=Eleutherodactylus coqui TaxID=57060 RepID=A0A8J6BKE1_ELECQ|nr:hypothetical protein GDO78_019922 [Eleutherodactylus coqui]
MGGLICGCPSILSILQSTNVLDHETISKMDIILKSWCSGRTLPLGQALDPFYRAPSFPEQLIKGLFMVKALLHEPINRSICPPPHLLAPTVRCQRWEMCTMPGSGMYETRSSARRTRQ